MVKSWELPDLASVEAAAPEIADVLQNHSVVLFRGEMGVGKTTLIKMLCKAWGVEDRVQSPTFSLVNVYSDGRNQPVYHFDFYRIHDEEEAMDIGLEEYLWSGSRCLIEWPEKIVNLLPPNRSEVKMEILDAKRLVEITFPDLHN